MTHSGMNKFHSPESADFRLVKDAIKEFVGKASLVLENRKANQKGFWLVPFGRNEDFVGREYILRELMKRILPHAKPDDCQRTAIEGLGGVGKTQIALEAAFRVRDNIPDCSVLWVSAVDINSFENSYREIGRKFNVKGIEEDGADVKPLVKAALSEDNAGKWLLIIDNADDINLLFNSLAPSDYLPFSNKGSILFTTRNHDVVRELDISELQVFPVGEMSRPDAIKMLKKNLNEPQMYDKKNTMLLLDFLADLPLAIKQASAYIARTRITTTEYLERCLSSDKTMIKLLSKDFQDRGRYSTVKNPIATTWLISFEQISRVSSLSAQYLAFLCFLAEKGIPRSLIPQAQDEIEADEAIGTLKAYAFITQREGQNIFDMHRLVRLAMQNWLDEKGEQEKYVTKVIKRLVSIYPFPKHENRDIWIEYLPHAQSALKFRVGDLDKDIRGDLLFNIGAGLIILGKDREAESMYCQTLNLRKNSLGWEHPLTLSSMNNLALVLSSLGKYDEAEELHRRTLELKKKVLGLEDSSTLSSMNNLALVLDSQKKYQEAEEMYQETLGLQKKVLGEEHPSTLDSMNNLALVLSNEGKYEKAEEMHLQTLKLKEILLGREHPSTLSSMNNLALVLSYRRKYKEAEAMHWQTLKLKEKVLGRDNPSTLDSMNNLATVLENQGKYEKAEEIHWQTLKFREKVLGWEHPSTLQSMNNFALVLSSEGKDEKAEEIHWQTLELKKKVLGKNHPSTHTSMTNVAIVLLKQGKQKEAEEMYRQTLELKAKVFGPKHQSTQSSKKNIAICLECSGKSCK